MSVALHPAPNHSVVQPIFLAKALGTTSRQIFPHYFLFELRIVLRHEKHPKGWISVQLLGCSSLTVAFLFAADVSAYLARRIITRRRWRDLPDVSVRRAPR